MSSDDREKGPRTDSAGRLPAPPPALYPCSREDCRQDRTWPPNDIVWFDGQDETLDKAGDIDRSKVAAGWYCVECVAELEIEPAGPRLDEALRAEGREDLPGEKRADPACTECAFYGGDADCCHPTSLIVHGNGVYDSASGMRRSWCGHGGMLFTPWPRRQKRQRVRARVLAVGRVTQIGAMQRVQIALDGERGVEIERPVGATTVQKLELAPRVACTTTLSHRPDGAPELEEWERADTASER